ncbi:C39 family peptidase [Patescibacteria group bacterium]|nr:C39 family peptidase [Patescibacteria group bacterium]
MKMRTKIILLICLVALGALLISKRVQIMEVVQGWQQPALPAAVSYEEIVGREEVGREDKIIKEPKPVDINLNLPEAGEEQEELKTDDTELEELSDGWPAQMNLAVPFTPQAPFSNWDLPFQEACEEASVYMVHEYYQGTPGGRIGAEAAEQALLKIVEYENALFGDYLDTSAAQTAILVEQMYGYGRVDLLANPTVEQIKEQIAAGRPVIVPAAGQQLHNPYFTQPGPLYHMLVIRGYTEKGFITNDPGTRHGEGYFYPFETLMSALHDWNGGDVDNGQKIILIIYPEN